LVIGFCDVAGRESFGGTAGFVNVFCEVAGGVVFVGTARLVNWFVV
jgi:hypothetical protein